LKADLLIFDGRHLLWRTFDAFHALGISVGGKEIGTGGIFGFLTVALRIHQRYRGVATVAWEGKTNFRRDLYPDYKRKEKPDLDRRELITDMAEQERRLKAILRAMGVRQYTAIHSEADDVIGRLANSGFAAKGHTVIYSGDSDLRQLVNDRVTVVAPGRRGENVVYNEKAVYEKHGVVPCYIADLKALAGDSSDNIPGVRGIGPKTAAKMLIRYGDVDDVINGAKNNGNKYNENWGFPERFKTAIIQNADNIRLYKKLTTIKTDTRMKPIKPKRNKHVLIRHLMAYRFQSLMSPAELNGLMRMGNG